MHTRPSHRHSQPAEAHSTCTWLPAATVYCHCLLYILPDILLYLSPWPHSFNFLLSTVHLQTYLTPIQYPAVSTYHYSPAISQAHGQPARTLHALALAPATEIADKLQIKLSSSSPASPPTDPSSKPNPNGRLQSSPSTRLTAPTAAPSVALAAAPGARHKLHSFAPSQPVSSLLRLHH